MPLHLASSRGSAKIMQLLIEHGVDVNANDKTFAYRIVQGIGRIMQLLINSGADVNVRDNGHSTPLHLASSSGSDEAMQLLIKHGVDVNAEGIRSRTPLETLPYLAFLMTQTCKLP